MMLSMTTEKQVACQPGKSRNISRLLIKGANAMADCKNLLPAPHGYAFAHSHILANSVSSLSSQIGEGGINLRLSGRFTNARRGLRVGLEVSKETERGAKCRSCSDAEASGFVKPGHQRLMFGGRPKSADT